MKRSLAFLRVYFIVGGGFDLLSLVWMWYLMTYVTHRPFSTDTTVFYIAFTIINLAYLYAGIWLKKLVATAPSRLNKIVIANAALVVINCVDHLFQYGLPSQLNMQFIASSSRPVISLLLTWYVLLSLKQQAAAQKNEAELNAQP